MTMSLAELVRVERTAAGSCRRTDQRPFLPTGETADSSATQRGARHS